jgi:hypothetical protein
MKNINTLSEDIYHVLDSNHEHETSETNIRAVSDSLGQAFVRATAQRSGTREQGKLWASDIGKPCLRQHYYKFNEPDKAEQLSGNTKFKFLYGDILEETVLCLGREAKHRITAEQERVETQVQGWTVSGRIDAVVDDTLIDVKSTSSYGYKKYSTEGINPSNDSFGYLEQLGYYFRYGDFSVDGTGFIFIDKQNGHIKYVPCEVPSKEALDTKIKAIIKAVEGEEDEAPKAFSPEPFGKSGNQKLSMPCSYCDFKQHCWRDSNQGKGLRGFVYSHGPVWMTEVGQEPRVPEIENET